MSEIKKLEEFLDQVEEGFNCQECGLRADHHAAIRVLIRENEILNRANRALDPRNFNWKDPHAIG